MLRLKLDFWQKRHCCPPPFHCLTLGKSRKQGERGRQLTVDGRQTGSPTLKGGGHLMMHLHAQSWGVTREKEKFQYIS